MGMLRKHFWKEMTIAENGEDYILTTDQIWGKVYTGENANFYSIRKGGILVIFQHEELSLVPSPAPFSLEPITINLNVLENSVTAT